MQRGSFTPSLDINEPDAIVCLSRDGVVFSTYETWEDEVNGDPMFADAALDAWAAFTASLELVTGDDVVPGVYRAHVYRSSDNELLSSSEDMIID